jgi:hypothetical protein
VDGSPIDGGEVQSLRLDEPGSLVALLALVQAHRPALLVLDPFRELHRKKENDADDMADILRPLRQLAHETETAVVLIHHRNKYGADSSTSVRGSSAISGSVDQVMTMELDGEEEGENLAPDRTLKVTVEGRYGPRRRLAAQLRPGLRWMPVRPTLDDFDVPGKIWRHLYLSGDACTADELVDAVGAAKRSVQNAMTELARSGQVARLGAGAKGDPYRYRSTSAADAPDLRSVENGKAVGRKDESRNRPEPSEKFIPDSSLIRPNGQRTPIEVSLCANCGLPRGTGGVCPNCGAAETRSALH